MKVGRLLWLGILLGWFGCADPGITVERSIFGPQGEKWCADVKDWRFVQIDRLNCGDCNQPCPENHTCLKSRCEPSAAGNNPNNSNETSYCADYLQCVYTGCPANCTSAADCLEIEQACANEEQMSLEELRDSGYVPLQCDTTTRRCFVPKTEPPPDDGEDPPVDPPPSVNKSDTCCGSSCVNCTETGQSCEGSGTSYSCVCNGCIDDSNGQCYSLGTMRDFPEDPRFTCGAQCKCLSTQSWGACTPLDFC